MERYRSRRSAPSRYDTITPHEDEEATSAPEAATNEAPAAPPASQARDTDTGSTTPRAISSAPAAELVSDLQSWKQPNDNSPIIELPAAGTE